MTVMWPLAVRSYKPGAIFVSSGYRTMSGCVAQLSDVATVLGDLVLATIGDDSRVATVTTAMATARTTSPTPPAINTRLTLADDGNPASPTTTPAMPTHIATQLPTSIARSPLSGVAWPKQPHRKLSAIGIEL